MQRSAGTWECNLGRLGTIQRRLKSLVRARASARRRRP